MDEVQNDRAGHSRMRVRVPMRAAGFPEDTYSNRSREIALRDLIARRFWESARTHARSPIPKTDGGEMYIPRPGQEILERGSVAVTQHFVEVSFTADLPSSGGKVNAQATEELIYSRIARVVSESMFFRAYKASKLYNHIQTSENADHIRSVLPGMGLAAFVATGSILPRRDDDLAPAVDAVPFDCDDSLKVSIEVPNGEPIEGMGLPSGFTVVTGRSRCGKSVLADAVFAGAYNHIPGDGREYVVSLPDAAYVMSEDGRPSDSVDVSAAIGGETSLQSASVPAPVSEAVSVSEAVETGSGLIILDEEYSSPCYIRCAYLAEDDDFVPLSKVAGAMGAAGISVLMVSGDRSAAEAADYLAEAVRGQIPEAEICVWEEDGAVLGFIGLTDGYVAGLFTAEGHRSRGIGRRLLEHCRERYDRLTLRVYVRNRRAVDFYLREGFSIVSEEMDEGTGEREYVMVWTRGRESGNM